MWGHYFHSFTVIIITWLKYSLFRPSFPVVDWFCLFIYLWVLTFPLEDCSEFGNFVITLIYDLPPYITYHRNMPVVVQELLPFRSIWVHSGGVFRGVCVCQSLVVCVLGTNVWNVVLFPFPTGYCTVCPSINVFWLHLLVSFLIMSAFVLPLYLPYRNVSSGWFILCLSQI
jgi:hypothetical protein